jgi:hypothetical protein
MLILMKSIFIAIVSWWFVNYLLHRFAFKKNAVSSISKLLAPKYKPTSVFILITIILVLELAIPISLAIAWAMKTTDQIEAVTVSLGVASLTLVMSCLL